MGLQMSETQQKRVDKIERLRLYFGTDRPEVYVWNPATDELLDYSTMSDREVAEHVGSAD
jgi:hypothetical protein